MSTQIYNPVDNRAFRGTTVDVQSSTMNNGMGGSHLKLNQPKQASKALLGSATKAAKFGKVLGPAGTILNAGVSIATADKSQGAAGIAGDVFAETGGYMLGAAKGAAIGSFLGPIGAAVGGVTGGLIGGGVASWGMDQVQNLWRQNTSSDDSTKYRNSPAPTANPNGIPQTGTATTTRGFADLRGSITPGSSDAAPTNNGAVLANAGADQWQQNKKSAGKDITKAEVTVLNKSYGSMSRKEINEAYDRMRYGGNFDKAREAMGKAKGNPFDSTNNPEKFLVDAAGQKKAVEQGLEMHKSFFAQGGGRSRELNGTSPTSSSRQSSPAAKPNEPGSGVRSERLGTFVSAHDKHINFSGKQQKNSPGSGQPGGRTVKDVFSRAVHPPSSSSRNKRGSGKHNNAAKQAVSRTQAHNGSSISQRYMGDLIAKGYSPEQAAGIVGNLAHESGNFKFHEELEANDYGTKGLGHLQWTNVNEVKRRDSFENYARSNKLDPKSYEANSGYLFHELAGGAGNHWTGGGGDAGYRKTGSLKDAVTHFQDYYVRPKKEYAHTDRRISYGQQALDEWRKNNS